jgi:arsenate reductase
MPDRIHTVLFLCSGNSARSVIAEAILNSAAPDRFKAYSAGSAPKGDINPHTVDVLRFCGHTGVSDLRSKSWEEFAQPGAPKLDFIITVCNAAAGESCPVWPGEPLLAHWGIPDPAKVTGSNAEIAAAFDETYGMLKRRIDLLLALPVEKLDRIVVTEHLKDIGRSEGATAMAKAG